MFWYIMDPRVKSIEDSKDGITNPDSWNDETPLSEDDKVRYRNCKLYLWFVYGVFTLSIKYNYC